MAVDGECGGAGEVHRILGCSEPILKWYRAQWRVQLLLLAAQYRTNWDKAKRIRDMVYEDVARHGQKKGGTEVEYLTLLKERLLQDLMVTVV